MQNVYQIFFDGRPALRKLAKTCALPFFIALDHIRLRCHSCLPRRNYVRSAQIGGMERKSEHVAVYVHFDRFGVIHDYVVHQLRELIGAGFDVIFVTNSPVFPQDSIDRVSTLCVQMIWRHNKGYDFGAYKDGIEAITHWNDLGRLVLMNDSVYGPFRPLSTIVSEFDATAADFWGIVDSWEGEYHLQSFFLCFHPRALKSAAFRSFWTEFPYIDQKGWIIRNGEIGLSQALAQHGLRAGAVVPYWSAAETAKNRIYAEFPDGGPSQIHLALLRGIPLNPMHHLWEHIVHEYKCPFIKRQFLRLSSNALKIQRMNVIRAHSNYDVSMIDRHAQSNQPQR